MIKKVNLEDNIMGLFDFLKSDKPSYSDKVWLNKDAALKGMLTEALQSLTQSEVPVVLSFFSDKQQEVIDFVALKNVPYTIIDANASTSIDKSVLLMDAQWLSSSAHAMDFLLQQSKTGALNLFFYGHYPIPEKENQLLSKIAATITLTWKLTFFSSLDDRAFELFGVENIKSILERLGLKEDEPIEHAMVTKSMSRAREKIADGVTQEIISSTEAEWYQRNYRKN